MSSAMSMATFGTHRHGDRPMAERPGAATVIITTTHSPPPALVDTAREGGGNEAAAGWRRSKSRCRRAAPPCVVVGVVDPDIFGERAPMGESPAASGYGRPAGCPGTHSGAAAANLTGDKGMVTRSPAEAADVAAIATTRPATRGQARAAGRCPDHGPSPAVRRTGLMPGTSTFSTRPCDRRRVGQSADLRPPAESS